MGESEVRCRSSPVRGEGGRGRLSARGELIVLLLVRIDFYMFDLRGSSPVCIPRLLASGRIIVLTFPGGGGTV